MDSSILFTLQNIDGNTGKVKASYILSKSPKQASQDDFRIDNITEHATDSPRGAKGSRTPLQRQYLNYVVQYLSALFLPIGYPHSVTEDYTTYQIFDSIQAFASSIAGLLSSRAVLQSLDVISSSSSVNDDSMAATSTSAATAATLLSVLQTTLANVTSILFASRAAPRISPEVKYYRFLADVVNDAAFVLDLLAPALASNARLPSALSILPISPRALVLCASSVLRAICGVAAGSSKAVLSNHFARNNPESVGDLNAKDGSQETVVGLVGMWVGGVVVSRVESTVATWCWMMALLCLHLWANYQAVRNVQLKTLNRERAIMVCRAMFAGRKPFRNEGQISVEVIRSNESILGIVSFCRSCIERLRGGHDRVHSWKTWRIGISLQEFLHRLDLRSAKIDTGKEAYFAELIRVFKSEAYLLHWNYESHQALVILKVNARPVDQLKAWLHATYIQNKVDQESELDAILNLARTLSEVQSHWDMCRSKLEEHGWNLNTTSLESASSHRLQIN